MNDSDNKPEVFKQTNEGLSELEAQQPGSLLRLRDVQALNRSFRRLSDVQDALLRQMEEQEQQRQRQTRWSTPMTALSGIAAALACGFLAWSLWFGPDIEIQAPEVTVQAPAVTVQAPDNAVGQETIDALLSELQAMRSEAREDRSMIVQLNERLLETERRELDRLQLLGRVAPSLSNAGMLNHEVGTTESDSETNASAELVVDPTLTTNPWLAATNGLLVASGYDHIRFETGTYVAGEASLHTVTLLEWNSDGVIDTVTKAAIAEFELHQMTGTLVVKLFDGHRVHGGTKVALPEDGWRLEFSELDSRLWLEQFPALANTPESSDPQLAEQIRQELDQLLATPNPGGYFRIPLLEDVAGTSLRFVQVNRYDNGGRLVRTLEADSLEVRLHPGGDVELLFRDGAILEGGLTRPFYEDRFRVYLPRQELDLWRRSEVPLIELG